MWGKLLRALWAPRERPLPPPPPPVRPYDEALHRLKGRQQVLAGRLELDATTRQQLVDDAALDHWLEAHPPDG